MEIIWTLIIGIVVGWLASIIVKGRGLGLIGNLVVGIVGSFLGVFVFNLLGVQAYSPFGSFVTAIIGAVIFLGILKMVKQNNLS